MSTSPLRKIVFIKRICLFASKNIPTLLVLSRSVNNEFSEALIEYGGFHETLTNLNHLALSSSARDQQPPILSFPIKRLIQFLSNYCSCAKWIFVELIEANFMNPQRAIEFIFEGEDEDEIAECLKVLFRKAKKRDEEEREYLEMTKAVADDDEFSSSIMSPVMIISSAHRLANTPVGLAQKLLAEKMMMKSDDKKSSAPSSLSTAYYSSNTNRNQVQPAIARLVPAPSSSTMSMTNSAHTENDNEDSVMTKLEELNLNKSRPLVLAAKRDLSKVFRVLLEEGEAEWNFFLTRAAGVPSVVCDYYVEESSENIEDLRKQCQKQQQQQQQEQQQQDDVNKVIEQIVRGIPSSSSSSVVADLRSKATHFLVKLFGDLSLKCLEVLFEFIIKKQQNSQGNKTIDDLLRDDFLVDEKNKNRHQHATTLLHLLLPLRIGDVVFETCLRCGPKFGPWLTHEEIEIHRNHFFAVIKFLLRQRDNGLLPISEKLLHERSLLIACNNSLTNIDILKMLINLTQEAEERGGKYSLSNLINYCGKNCRADDDEDGFNYSLTPLLAAVTCKRLDLVEFFLSMNEDNNSNIKVDVTKNIEDSNGGWIAFMERNYSLWAHRYEETMNMFVSNNQNQNDNDNTTQPKKNSPEGDEDWNMSWGDDSDEDTGDGNWSSAKNDQNKKEPQQIKTNVISSGLTLEAIVFSHKRKLQDTKTAKILELLVEAKEKEKKGICHQHKKDNKGGIKKD